MALKTNGRMLKSIIPGNRRLKSATTESYTSGELSSSRVPVVNEAKILSILPGQKVFVNSGVTFDSEVAVLEKMSVTEDLPGIISSRRYGSRSNVIPSVPVPVANLGQKVPLNLRDSATEVRKYRLVIPVRSEDRRGVRVPKEINPLLKEAVLTSPPTRVSLGSSTIGVGYVPQNQGPPPGDPKPVRRWPRDWHGDNMHN